MSKQIKEKCKECKYYNENQQYPNVDGATTHRNCLSVKCNYSKITKDIKIARLEQKLKERDNAIEELKEELADAEEHIDSLELQLREQYQLVDEMDEKLAEREKEIEKLKKEQIELLEQVRQEIAVKDKIGLRLFIDGKIKEIKEKV